MKLNKIIVGFLLLLISAPTLANFTIYDDEEYFGNAQTPPFQDAVAGTEAIKPEELAYLNAVDITRVINRWYVRFFFGNPRMKLNDIGNTSATPIATGLTPGVNEVTKYLYNWSFAGGKVWQQWVLEFELLFMKELDFTISPSYFTVPLNSQVKINQASAFINVQYIIPRYFSWYPKRLQVHLDGGLGAALKMTDISLFGMDGTPFQSGSRRTLQPAANLGLGARYQLTANVLFDVSYRYFFFGKTDIGPANFNVEQVEYQASKFQANGFFLGLFYQF